MELAKEPHRGIAARIPSFEEIWFIGVEQTIPRVAAAFAPRKRGGPEIALDCPETQPHVLGNRGARPPLMVQGPHLRMQGLPARLALRRALLRRERDVMGGHRDGQRSIREWYGPLVHQIIDGVEGLAVCDEHLVQCFSKILEQVEAVRELRR